MDPPRRTPPHRHMYPLGHTLSPGGGGDFFWGGGGVRPAS